MIREIAKLTVAALAMAVSAAEFQQVDIFKAGEGGYHTYRIPALAVTKRGTLLAFCEGRRAGAADTGDIDVLVRRSQDGGRTWSAQRVIAHFDGYTVGNPAPVIDSRTGHVVLLLTANPANLTERQIVDGAPGGSRTVWITRSADDGSTWSEPEEITAAVKRPEWTWYATGPGNGIQLRDGRMVVACDHITAASKKMHSHVIFSDDGGRTWSLGGVAEEKTNESAVVELGDGSLMLNMRSYHGKNRRAVAVSKDRGRSWADVTLAQDLIEPVCQASLIRFDRDRLVFSNPADVKRVRMTIKVSRDEGASWPVSRVVHEGPSAYSALARLKNGQVGLLYERGAHGPYEQITFARFDIKWVEGPK